jgi:3-hydroxybutyryl-CoA dehydrogenase
VDTLGVIGAGTMGAGIAQTFAMYGYTVYLYDTSIDATQKALQRISQSLLKLEEKKQLPHDNSAACLNNIKIATAINDLATHATIIVEAASELKEIKLSLFAELGKLCDDKTILASNTSSISIEELGNQVPNPSRVIGMHFMNPVPLMKLVEVVKSTTTSAITLDKIVNLSALLNKTPVVVNDAPGFISNRVLMPMIHEAIIAFEEGIASVDAIDEIMKLGMAHPMGPLELADFIGLDVCKFILDVMYEGFDNEKYKPCTTLVSMVLQKQLGKKTGSGFYIYENGKKVRPAL